MHPTVKPVAMVKDAILDCSNRGDLVLDCFAGSGSRLIAQLPARLQREVDPNIRALAILPNLTGD